jgi:hypothetical protein
LPLIWYQTKGPVAAVHEAAVGPTQPSRILQAAKAIGVTVPAKLLALADEVIE